MLDTNSIQASSGQAAVFKGPNQMLGQDQFLNLLIAQLKHQDPLKPMDSSDFVAQLAQFSQLEQSKQMTTSLNAFIQRQDSANANNLVTLLNHSVTALGNSVSLTSGTPPPLQYSLAGNAATVNIQVLNSAGQVVRTLSRTDQGAGVQSVTWNGKDDNGNALASGTYSFAVAGKAANGDPITATTLLTGRVTSLRYDGAVPSLVFENGQTILSNQITSVQS